MNLISLIDFLFKKTNCMAKTNVLHKSIRKGFCRMISQAKHFGCLPVLLRMKKRNGRQPK